MPRTLFIILARGGSKGLPRKNLQHIAGAPLVGRAARLGTRCLQRLGGDGRVVVSTDDEEIAACARFYGAETPFLRPTELATDTADSASAVRHALAWYDGNDERFDEVVLLQPTAPLTRETDVINCIHEFRTDTQAPVVAVANSRDHSDMIFHLTGSTLHPTSAIAPVVDRHNRAPQVRIAGSIYVCASDWLDHNAHWLIPGTTRGVLIEQETVDIDDHNDFVRAAECHRLSLPWEQGRVLIIAEAGCNHNGDVGRALELVDAAADAGADCIKFQAFSADEIVARRTPMAAYQQRNVGCDQSMHAMLRDLELSQSDFERLRARCEQRGIQFCSSPFSLVAVSAIDALEPYFFKIPSGEITNIPMLKKIAMTGRPIVMSTGMSTLSDVEIAVNTLRTMGNNDIALLQCESNYPAVPANANLRAMETMQRAFGVTVGYSDHTLGHAVSCAAVAVGARILEKHFTTDKTLPGPDHVASLEPHELTAYVNAIRDVECSLGDGIKAPTTAELDTQKVARKSLVAARDLPAGHTLILDDIAIKRPGTGLAPAQHERVTGKRLNQAIRRDELLRLDMLCNE